MMSSSAPITDSIGDLDAELAPDPYVAGAYFTDGVNLYRLVGWLERRTEPLLAEIEDCRTLDCALLERAVLVALGLRPVPRG